MATTKRSVLSGGHGGTVRRADGDREGRISGDVLKIIRAAAGLTQDALAEQLGVDTTTGQGWESGQRSLMAVSAGTYLRVRHHLVRLGVSARLIGQLDMAMEVDRFVGYVLGANGPVDRAEPYWATVDVQPAHHRHSTPAGVTRVRAALPSPGVVAGTPPTRIEITGVGRANSRRRRVLPDERGRPERYSRPSDARPAHESHTPTHG